jgi:hypothetical protein
MGNYKLIICEFFVIFLKRLLLKNTKNAEKILSLYLKKNIFKNYLQQAHLIRKNFKKID